MAPAHEAGPAESLMANFAVIIDLGFSRATLIGRDWYEFSDWRLSDDGRCRDCGATCAGVFDGPPGLAGRRPVRLLDAAA